MTEENEMLMFTESLFWLSENRESGLSDRQKKLKTKDNMGITAPH